MRNVDLAKDHLKRASARMLALDTLFDAESWADVVRESQEVVELSLKGLLRAHGVQPPRVHDVSEVMIANAERLPEALRGHLAELAEISKRLRLSRELAFYGAEDLTPSDFYSRKDAQDARTSARRVVELVAPHVG